MELVKAEWYDSLVEDCNAIRIERSYNMNEEIYLGKWEIGERICTDSNYKKFPGSKNALLKNIFKDIRVGRSDGYLCVQFYEQYPTKEKLSMCVDRFGKVVTWTKIKGLLPEHKEEQQQLPFPDGKFNVIYADPPWQYDFSETQSREIEKNYPTLQPQEIIDLADKNGRLVKNVFHKDAVLFLWATAPKLKQCLDVLEEWGFEYKTNAIWDKKIIGMGYWFRGQHELLLVGTKGKFSPPIEESRESSVYTEKRTAHSKKPDYYYELIEKYFPNGKGLELFNRGGAYSNYWTVWGNEIE